MKQRRGAVGVVLAAGMGTRVGADGNKAYLTLAGRSMVSWSLAAIAQVTEIARVVLVFRQGERELAGATVARELPDSVVEFVEGGITRHASEFNVLSYLARDIDSGMVDVVLIHDAARPLAGPDMMMTAISVAREFGGGVPAIPATDVVRLGPSGDVDPLSRKADLVRVQTPQAFRSAPLLAAYRSAERERFEGTDTASCVERFTNLQVHIYAGAEHNLKVTFAHDVAVAERLLAARISCGPPDGTR